MRHYLSSGHKIDLAIVWEVIEASAIAKGTGITAKANASRQEVLNHRDYLLRFLTEVDGDLNVGDLVYILEEYRA